MSSISPLEQTVSKVLTQKEAELIAQIESAYHESLANLESSRTTLHAEYNQILDAAKKQAENLKRQIIGSSRLSTRNKQLLLLETAVNDAFEKAMSKLLTLKQDEKYRNLIYKMLEDSISAINSDEIIVECNKTDYKLVKKAIEELKAKGARVKITLSENPIEAIGGIRASSKDRSMTYDNTLDSRIERLKPLIRKNIVQILRGEK